MRDDTLVSKQSLETTLGQLGENGSDSFLSTLMEAEPGLGGFLTHNATLVAGKLALTGAPQEVIQGVHSDLLAACAVVYWAVRQGSYEIWEGTALGDRLRALQPAQQTAAAGTAVDDTEQAEGAADSESAGEHVVVLLGTTAGRKRELVRALRQLTGQPLRQVRRLLEQTPVAVFRGLAEQAAVELQAQLEQAGGRAVVLLDHEEAPAPNPPAANQGDEPTTTA
jgi:ribosomal protein L7/L12